jgi:hypothetical protein
MRCARVFEVLVLLVLILTISIPSLGQNPKDNPLTNADLVRLVKAGVSENTILRVMQVSETNFTTSADALIELKHHHVPDRVIDAMFDTRAGASRAVGNQTEQLTYSSRTVEPRPPGPAKHLPNIDAAIRLNGKMEAKVAVRQNHINVESGGHPLFSATWKVKDSH